MTPEYFCAVMSIAFHPALPTTGLQLLFLEFMAKPEVSANFKGILKHDKDPQIVAAYGRMKAKLKQKVKSKKLSESKTSRRFFTLSRIQPTDSELQIKDHKEEIQSYFYKVF